MSKTNKRFRNKYERESLYEDYAFIDERKDKYLREQRRIDQAIKAKDISRLVDDDEDY